MKKVVVISIIQLMWLPALMAQGILIHKPVKLSRVRGVVLFYCDNESLPQPDATVEITDFQSEKCIMKTVTGENGRFDFCGVPKGKYWLRICHYAIVGLTVELHVEKDRKQKDCRYLEVILKNLPYQPGGGATIEVKENDEIQDKQNSQSKKK